MKPKGLFAILPDAQKGKPSTRFSRMMIIISMILAALFLYLALRNLNWHIFLDTIKNAQYAYLPIVLLWGSMSFLIRALRLRILLISEIHLRFL